VTSVNSIKAATDSATKAVAHTPEAAPGDVFGGDISSDFMSLVGSFGQALSSGTTGNNQGQGQGGLSSPSSNQTAETAETDSQVESAALAKTDTSQEATADSDALPAGSTAASTADIEAAAPQTIASQPILLNGTQTIVIPQSTVLAQLGLTPKSNPSKISTASESDATAQNTLQNTSLLKSSASEADMAAQTTASAGASAGASKTAQVKPDSVNPTASNAPTAATNSEELSAIEATKQSSAFPASGISADEQISATQQAQTALSQTQDSQLESKSSGDPATAASTPPAARKAPVADGSELAVFGGLVAAQTTMAPVTPLAGGPVLASKNSAPASGGVPVANDSDDDDAEANITAASKVDSGTDTASAPLPAVDANAGNNSNSSSNNDPAKSQDFAQTLLGAAGAKDKSATTAATTGSASFADTVNSASGTSSSSPGINTIQGANTASGFATNFSAANSSASSMTYVQATPEQVSVVLQRAASNQVQSMTIALDPAELGKVEVRLNFGKDGAVTANVTADRAETLSMLKNDHGALTQALQNAGLSADSSSLNFNLSSNSQQQAQQDQNASGGRSSTFNFEAAVTAPTPTAQTLQASSNGRLDLLV
jgi:flagellar hook-length control protein FliK